MNCVNHGDRPAAAFCQNCGKPLCAECVRSVAGQVFDEGCLAARLGSSPPPGNSSGWSPVSGVGTGPHDPVRRAYDWSVQQGSNPGASPVLGGLLGFIPGVAAMYNGQFIKALVHVVIFIFLVGLTKEFDLAGILVAAWVFYQVFDGIQTAVARRDGLPLPDPFGLNDLGQRLGMPAARAGQPTAPSAWEEQLRQAAAAKVAADAGIPFAQPAPGASAPPSWENPDYAAAAQAAAAQAATPFSGPGGYAAVPPAYSPVAAAAPPPPLPARAPEPIGAIVLIAVGILFLLSTLGVLHADWIGRGWPIIIIVVGVWLLVRRLRYRVGANGGGL